MLNIHVHGHMKASDIQMIRERIPEFRKAFGQMPMDDFSLRVHTGWEGPLSVVTLILDTHATGNLVARSKNRTVGEGLAQAMDALKNQVKRTRSRYLSLKRCRQALAEVPS